MADLSPEARAWAIERILSHVAERYIEQLAIEAPTETEAIKAVRAESAWSGGSDPNGSRWHCFPAHIDVQYPDGSRGVLTWREVVRAARSGMVITQMRLF